jgi:putative SOS response-associated peptidase YedK
MRFIYEWQKMGAAKRPYAIVPEGDPIFAFAGLWENWRDRAGGPDAEWIRTCTIITGEPNELVAPIHNRMPVILRREAWPQWLGEGSTIANGLDPELENAVLVRQQPHDLEWLGPEAVPLRPKGHSLSNFELVSRHRQALHGKPRRRGLGPQFDI